MTIIRGYKADTAISNYWILRIIERGARENLPTYSIKYYDMKNPNVIGKGRFIAEGIWLSKVARALYE